MNEENECFRLGTEDVEEADIAGCETTEFCPLGEGRGRRMVCGGRKWMKVLQLIGFLLIMFCPLLLQAVWQWI